MNRKGGSKQSGISYLDTTLGDHAEKSRGCKANFVVEGDIQELHKLKFELLVKVALFGKLAGVDVGFNIGIEKILVLSW